MSSLLNTLIPPAAPSSASATHPMKRIGTGIWHWLEAVGRAKAQRHLDDWAERYEPGQPDLAAQMRVAGRHNG